MANSGMRPGAFGEDRPLDGVPQNENRSGQTHAERSGAGAGAGGLLGQRACVQRRSLGIFRVVRADVRPGLRGSGGRLSVAVRQLPGMAGLGLSRGVQLPLHARRRADARSTWHGDGARVPRACVRRARGLTRSAQEQYFGKWPFVRVLGIQELASVLFSFLNLLPHVRFLCGAHAAIAPPGLWYRHIVWTFASVGVCVRAHDRRRCRAGAPLTAVPRCRTASRGHLRSCFTLATSG